MSELSLSLDELLGLSQPSDGSPAPTTRAGLVDGAGVAPVAPGVWEEQLAPDEEEIEFLSVTYDTRNRSGRERPFVRRSGRQYGLVLAGALEVTVGFETHLLGPGDAIAFDSTTPHRIENCSNEPARAVWVHLRSGD